MSGESDLQRLETALHELRTINRIVERICRARETSHIFTIVIDELVKETGALQGVMNLLERKHGDELVTMARDRRPDSHELPFKVSQLVSGWVLKNKQVLKVDDLDHDERFAGLSSEDGRFKSLLCCPMETRGETIGLLSLVRNSDLGPFSDNHARLAGIVAAQAASILSNTLLLEALARKNELLETAESKLREENARLKSQVSETFAFENIVGRSEPMRRVLTLASKVSAGNSPILIAGPTGTGKELIARAIHFNGARRDQPFVVKNCGVKTESLLESELFGHVKGAFTGADRDKPGLFHQADGGTVFLDEIGDAPMSTQVAILRVLESGEIRPIGSNRTEIVDVRIISATNRDLRTLIGEKQFREDLLYRLNTVTIEMPPLKHRREDIPLLVHYFLDKLRMKLNRGQLSVSSAVLDTFGRYDWPGNVRQLEHELERAAIVCDESGIIETSDLSADVLAGHDAELKSADRHGRLRDAVERLEINLITATLTETNGNILRSAKLLGLTRKGLKDKMARYDISPERS